METSYPLDDNFTTSGVQITEEIKAYLYEMAKWGKFLSIMGFIFIGFMAFGVLSLLFVGGTALAGLDEFGAAGGLGFGFIAILYGLMIVLYFFPTLYLYRFSDKVKIALNTDDQITLSEGFKNLKSLFKFWGIFTAILLGFYAILFIGSIFIGGLGMFL